MFILSLSPPHLSVNERIELFLFLNLVTIRTVVICVYSLQLFSNFLLKELKGKTADTWLPQQARNYAEKLHRSEEG